MWHSCIVENICEVEIFETFAIEHQDSVCARTDWLAETGLLGD